MSGAEGQVDYYFLEDIPYILVKYVHIKMRDFWSENEGINGRFCADIALEQMHLSSRTFLHLDIEND